MAPAWSPRRVKQPCSLAGLTSTIPAPGRQQSLALPGFSGHSGAQRHRKAQGDGSKPTGLGQPALQRSPSAPLGVQVPLKSGPQHCKSGAEWGGEPRDEVCRLLPFHVQFPAGPGTACSECRAIFLTAHRGHGWQPCSILSSTALSTTALAPEPSMLLSWLLPSSPCPRIAATEAWPEEHHKQEMESSERTRDTRS